MALQVEQLSWCANDRGAEIAYRQVQTGDELTFTEWEAAANRLARGLTKMGVRVGERVALYLDGEDVLAWITAYAAIHKAGAVAVPTNTRFTSDELGAVLGHSEPAVVITSSALRPTFDEVAQSLPSVRHLIEVSSDAAHSGGFGAVMAEDDSSYQVAIDEDDLADIMYTSGTTGLPKGIAVRHGNLAIIPNGEPERTAKSWLHGSPLFTFAGISFIYNPMKMGMSCNYLPRFDVTQWFDTVESRRPSMTFLVPAMAQLLSTSDRFESADLSSLEMVAIGSAPLPPSLHHRLANRLPDAMVSNSYSMTEAGTAFTFLPREELERRSGSVGIPLGTEIRIADEAGETLAPGNVGEGGYAGEVCNIGEVLIHVGEKHREYFRNPEATAQTWSGEWLRSGDLGWMDPDGYLYITGRAKDVIIRGGNNVHSADVEAVIYQHPAVLEAAVAAVPHEVLGEDVGAWIVTREGAELTAEELTTFCREHLADYKCPRAVTFVSELPRNPTGKILKRDLPPPALY